MKHTLKHTLEKFVLLAALVPASIGVATAQQARVVSAFLGAQFFDTSAALETSPVIGARWAWFSRSGHGVEFTLDYTETRAQKGQIALLFGASFFDPQTVPEQLEKVTVDYAYVARGGIVRPYVLVGGGYLRGEIAFSQRAVRFVQSLNRSVDSSDTSLVYEAGAGVLVGDERLRFRYDLRLIRMDDLFDTGGTTSVQTTGGFAWVF